MRMVFRSFLGLSLAVLAACPGRDVAEVDPKQSKEQQKEIPISLNRNIDILFVVDDSGSMAQEQEALVENFQNFITVLESIEGGLPNVHMAVVSSNVGTGPGGGGGDACEGNGDNGVMQVPPGCPLNDGKRYISDILIDEEAGTRMANYDGALADQFSCMAALGTGGCGFEMHFESMKRALDNNNENAGFLRDDAFLAVIILADEDDCSASNRDVFDPSQDDINDPLGELTSFRCFEFGTTCEGVSPGDERNYGGRQNCLPDDDSPYIERVSTYVDYLKELKGDPSKVIVAGIVGPDSPVTVGEDTEKDPSETWVEPACMICPGQGNAQLGDCPFDYREPGAALVAAAPGVRMKAFIDSFPQRSTFQNICTYNDATGGVDLSGGLTQIALLLKKVVGNPCLDGNLTDPPDCRVSDIRNLNTDDQEEFPIPSCDDGGTPCFSLVPNADCDTESGLSLEIDRGGTEPPSDTTVVARCLVE